MVSLVMIKGIREYEEYSLYACYDKMKEIDLELE